MIVKHSLSYLRLVTILLLIYCAAQIYCINQLSVNYDEGSFALYGTTLLKLQREKDVIAFESKLPITALNMLPRAAEQLINPGLTRNWPASQIDIINGRYISLFFVILLGLLIYHWSSQLYNHPTALTILLTYLLCPNFLAYGIFVSSDIFACFFMTATLYFLWLFFRQHQWKHFILMCVATGLAEISKFSMFHLFLLLPLLFVVKATFQKNSQPPTRFGGKKLFSYVLLFLFINWAIISCSHLFYQVFAPISQYTFLSSGFKSLQQIIGNIFPGFPVPLPSSYIGSMDAVMYFDQLGGGVKGSLNGAPYILGQYSVNGFWYYYFIAIFYKVPIPLLLLWISALLLFCLKFSWKSFSHYEIFLLFPVLYFLVYMNFFYSTQVGIRHIMIVFPLLFIFSGRAIMWLSGKRRKGIIYLLLVYQAISVLAYFPHFLPYTNEFVSNKKLAYKKIADTNLCYAEGGKYLQAYLDNHRQAVYKPEKPVAGRIVVEVNDLLNLNMATIHQYDWLNSLVPTDHIHSQYLVFEVTQPTLDSLQKLRH